MGKWTRRAFISTGVLAGGVLAIGVAIRPGNRSSKVKDLVADGDETVFDVWLKIAPDNTLTVIIPHAEMGQGVHTALAMMLADELDADWSKVKTIEAPAHKEYANYAVAKGFLAGERDFPAFLTGTVDGFFLTATKKMHFQITGGSASVRFTGTHAMRVTGAAVKSILLEAAAETWSVPREELSAKESHIFHAASGRSAPYADFAAKAATLSMHAKPQLKSVAEFSIIGTSPPRMDIPAKVDGTARFGIDVALPGMKYATIKAAPVFGSRLKSVNADAVSNMPGIHRVIELDNAVAVVADGYWLAKRALDQLEIEFQASGHEHVTQQDIYEQYSRDLDAALEQGKMETDVKSGDIESALAEADRIVEAEYRVPYLAHATMEPMNCTAWVHDDQCELWVGSQNPLGFAHEAADLLDMDAEQVTVHNQFLGGGFGRRAEADVVRQAVLIAREVDFPVKLIWSREEDIRQDFYREANLSRFKAALNAEGMPIAWNNRFLFKHHPQEAPYIPYGIDHQLLQYTNSKTHIPWGNWRSVDHSMHGFFTESFIDELAHAGGKDPYEYRRDLLGQAPRFQKVLDLAAEKAGWGNALPANWGRGIALHKSFGTIVAEVVEVEVSDDGKLRTHRVVCVADPGFAVHPDGFRAQMESGIIYGLTAALYGEITIQKGAVVQSNFHDYQMLRINETPTIEIHIVSSDNFPGGAGEPSTPVIAPALANAIFDASGKRIRELPVKNHDLRREKTNAEHLG